ncbi:zinc finger protein 91-like [Centruroides sculpturatus]|uniref:zinc finger protein 91-like n=1 Tax=Centruroides sculpturatus TaxID=218467 RepID=UPI000C6DFC09|nr:zinc finger protein 91-like [Centruroides sculpturatus]
MEADPEKAANRCHVCGNCWKMFNNPQELQEHCLQCFQGGRIKTKAIQDKENALNDKDCDVSSNVMDNNYNQYVNETFMNLNDSSLLTEDYYSLFTNQSEDSSYQCKICWKVFTNYGSYRRHLRMHITGKSHICGECGKRYFRRYLLIQHAEKAHGSTRQSIRLCHCGMWFKDTETLKQHNQKAHNKEPLQACGLPLQRLRYSQKRKNDLYTIVPEEKPNQYKSLFGEESNINRQTNQEIPYNQPVFQNQVKKNPSQENENNNSVVWLCTICSQPLKNREEVLAHRQVCYPMSNNNLPRKRQNPNNLLNNDNKIQILESDSIVVGDQELPCDLSVKESIPKLTIKRTPKRGIFVCETCQKTFINHSSYLRHRRMHLGMKPSMCEYCCMSFFRSESLNTHIKNHHLTSEYICFECGHRANDAFSLREHFQIHEGKEIILEQTDQTENTIKDLNTSKTDFSSLEESTKSITKNEYISETNEDKVAGYCKICQKNFYKLNNYNRHMKLHKNSFHATQWFTCTLCGKVSLSHKDHQDHLKVHSSTYTCSKCSVCFQDEEKFNIHTKECMKGWAESEFPKENEATNGNENANDDNPKVIDNKENETFNGESEICNDNENSKIISEEIMPPTDATDKRSKSFFCKICVRKFTNQGSFRRHVRMHKGNWIHSCKYCGKYFFRKDHLQHHESSRHFGMESNGDIFCCYYCSVCYPDPYSLKEHVISSHKVPGSHYVQSSDKTSSTSNEKIKMNEGSDVSCNSESELEADDSKSTDIIYPLDYSNKASITSRSVNGTAKAYESNHQESGGYGCIKCSLVFQSMTEMVVHLKDTHGLHRPEMNNLDCSIEEKDTLRRSQGSYKQCSRCHRQFSTHNSLLSHLCTKTSVLTNSSESKSSRKYVCNLCLKEYNEAKMLEAHKQLAHVVMDMYECSVCHHKGSQEIVHIHMLSHMQKCGTFVSTIETYPQDQEEQILAQTKAKINCKANYNSSQNNEFSLSSHRMMDSDFSKTEVEKNVFHTQEIVPFVGVAGQNFQFNSWNARNDYNLQQRDLPVWTNEQNANSIPVSQYPSSEVEEITVEPALDILTIAASDNADSEKLSVSDVAEVENEQLTLLNDDNCESLPSSKPKRPRAIVLFQRGKKIYKCEECERVFINYSSCKRHRRQHTGVWKHGCTICGRVFFRKDQCDKHVKSHSIVKDMATEY